jgi:hypothetical protein
MNSTFASVAMSDTTTHTQLPHDTEPSILCRLAEFDGVAYLDELGTV